MNSNSQENPGVEFYVKGMMAERKEERIPLLEKALKLGVPHGVPEIDAKFSLGYCYALAGGSASGEQTRSYWSKALNLMEEAILADTQQDCGYFNKPDRRSSFEAWDVLYDDQSETIYKNAGVEQAITYLEQKLSLFGHLTGTSPMLGSLANLGRFYAIKGNFERARQCYRQVLEAEPVRLSSQREAKIRQGVEEYLPKLDGSVIFQNEHKSRPITYVYKCPDCGQQMEIEVDIDTTICGNCGGASVKRYRRLPSGTLEEITKPGGGGGCYIATACYGSYDAPEVVVLRGFRDQQLSKSYWGRAFIRQYYKYAPYVARQLQNKPTINNLIKHYVLNKIVQMLTHQ